MGPRALRHTRFGAFGELRRPDAARRGRKLDLTPTVDFLKSRRTASGTWMDFTTLAGTAIDWPTGYVADALLAISETALVEGAIATLIVHQQWNGGWGYHRSVPDDADSTSYVLASLANAGTAGAVVARGATRLVEQQHPDGAFSTYASAAAIRAFMGLPDEFNLGGWTQAHNEVTAAAGRALALASEHRAAQEAWRFLEPQQEHEGKWRSYWWTTDLYATAQVVRLGRLIGAAAASSLALAVRWCEESQTTEGAWRDDRTGRASVFATALALIVLGSEGGADARRRGEEWLLGQRRADGGWDGELVLRIPLPWTIRPEDESHWMEDGRGAGSVVRDAGGSYTTATVLLALAGSTA